MRTPTLQANGMLLAAAMLWGLGNIAQKTILDDIGPFTAVGLRCLIGALFILPFARRENRLAATPAVKAGSLVLLSLLFAGALAAMQLGFATTSVTNAGFLVNTCTVLTPIAAFVMFREAPPVLVWPAAALSLLGVVLLGGGGFAAPGAGDALCLASAAFYALWIVLLGRIVTRCGSPARITVAQFVVAGSLCLVIGLVFEPLSLAGLVDALPELALLGVFSTGLAYTLQASAQRTANATTAAILMSAEAPFGALAANLLLGENLGALGVAGAALIALAVIVVHLPAPDRARRAAA